MERANFNLSQFLSVIVAPNEIPRIWVCAAPDTPTAQTSELITVTAGATAVGGGDFTVVVLFEVESVVLLLVESVTIGWAIAGDKTMTKSTAAAIFLVIFKPFLVNLNNLTNYHGNYTI
jgi:hypothetical protein